MSYPDRVAVAAALTSLVESVSWGSPSHTWAYTSQRLQTWTDCPAQPALYVCEGDEAIRQTSGLERVSEMEFRLVCYQNVGMDTSNVRPATENDLILQAIEDALSPNLSPSGRVTLGGLVHHTRIEGTVMKDSGDLDGQGMLVIPIKIILP